MSKICKYLGYAEAVFGAIGSFMVAKSYGVATHMAKNYSIEVSRDWLLTIGIFLGCLFSITVICAILLGISEILDRLEPEAEPIDYSNSIVSKAIEEEEKKTFWKCPTCGKLNPPYTGTCSCGQAKD